MEKNILEKTPREEEKLGRNREDHLKTDNQKYGKVGNEIKW